MGASKLTLEDIAQAEDEWHLLSIAYCCQGDIKSGQIKSGEYAELMVALSERLGFGITDEALAKAAAKYLK